MAVRPAFHAPRSSRLRHRSATGWKHGAVSAASPDEPADGERPPVTVLVCETCRLAGDAADAPRAGALLADAVAARTAGQAIRVRRVACLANCKRGLSAALLRPGSWSYVFGDLGGDAAADLVDGARLFDTAKDGVLPWRGRPDSLKRGMVARIPPMALFEEPA